MFVDDLNIVRKYRKSFVWNHIYHMTMTVLALTNVVFFIYNWKDMKVMVDEPTLILTFLGFLFAFAGINIYSIFNTNVEAEKETLRNLANNYEESLRMLDSFMLSIKKLGVMQQTGLLITTTPKMTNQHFSWLQKCTNLYKAQEEFLRNIYNAGIRDKANEYLADFTDVCQGISVSLTAYLDRINKEEEQYFDAGFDERDRKEFIERVMELKIYLDNIESFSFIQEIAPNNEKKTDKLSTCEKLRTVWNDLRDLFIR